MVTINWAQTELTIERIVYLFRQKYITNTKNVNDFYYISVLTEMLILLRDLAAKLDRLNNRIDYDVLLPNIPGKKDITDIIAFFRDAACHTDSNKRVNSLGYIKANNIHVNVMYEGQIYLEMGSFILDITNYLVKFYLDAVGRLLSYPQLDVLKKKIEVIGKLI